MMEIVEYRPGKWVKVVDGRIAGRATADEVAAWQAKAGREPASEPSPQSLDIDIDLGSALQAGNPGHTLDVPLQPAFTRRRIKAGERNAVQPAPEARSEDPEEITIEMAIAREAMSRRRTRKSEPEQEASAPVMVRRRLPPREAPPPEAAHNPQRKEKAPEDEAPAAQPKRRAPSQTENPPTGAGKAAEGRAAPATPQTAIAKRRSPAAEAQPSPPSKEIELEDTADQEPSYWWVHNAQGQSIGAFLREWLPKYKAKFGHEATRILCHKDDYAAVQECAANLNVEVTTLVQPGHFYFSHSAEEG